MSRYINYFDEDKILQVIMAYLIEGKSHRQIQRDILSLPVKSQWGLTYTIDRRSINLTRKVVQRETV